MQKTSLSFLEQLQQEKASEQWVRLVDLYTPVLQNWLQRYDDLRSEDIEDLIKDVLLVVSQELPTFRHNRQPGAFRCWLRRILVNRLRHFWRTQQGRPQGPGGSGFLEHLRELEEASGISEHWDREHDLHVMRQLLEQVQPRFAPQTWQAFRLQVIEGKSPEEVAEALQLPTSSVYVAKCRVLQALRKTAEGLLE